MLFRSQIYHHYGTTPFFTVTPTSDSVNTVLSQNRDGTLSQDRIVETNLPSQWPVLLGYVQKASTLRGISVVNFQHEELGKVDNLIVDLTAGRIVAAVISSGAFIGLGDELSPVPPAALRYDAQRSTLQLNASKEALLRAPHFKADQWPDLGQPGSAGSIYRSYGVRPYFTSTSVDDEIHAARK